MAGRAITESAEAKLRILVLEDHADTAQLLQRILRGDGHEVDIASTLAAARGALKAGPYDLLITDIELPDGVTYDLLKPGGPAEGLVAIVISGHGMPDHLERSRAAGVKEHLVKPFSITQLRQAIRRVTS